MTSTQRHITDKEILILQKLLGQRLFRLYTIGLTYEKNEFWSTRFSLDFNNKRIGTDNFRPFIEIAADYKLSNSTSTTYFEFQIQERNTPEGIKRNSENSLEWPFVEIKLWTDPIEEILIFQDTNIEEEEFIFDRLLVLKTKSEIFSIEATDELKGGVTFCQTKSMINNRMKELEKRKEIKTQPNNK